MKKLIIILINFCLIAWWINQAISYDEVFPSIKLRHWQSYNFWDEVNNNNNFRLWISYNPSDNAGIRFSESWDFNDNWIEDTANWFRYTDNVSDNFIMEPFDSYKVIGTSYPYEIVKFPLIRKPNNIEIVYTLAKWRNEGNTWFGPTYHTEYQPYEITWCGDGQRDNYTEDFGEKNVVFETCDPNDSLKLWFWNWGCSVTCNAINFSPSITIDKHAANPADRDGNLTDDSQLISYNTDAVFKITVRNNWDENLKEVRIEDPKAWDCSMTIEETRPFIQAIWNNDDIFDIGEEFDYTCTKLNVVLEDINLATVYGKWVISEIDVNAQDTSPYIIDPSTIPALISIDKVDANIEDLDTDIGGNDSQTVVIGSGAIFQITLTNTWNDDLINIEITDAITPACDLSLASLLIWGVYTYICTHDNSIEDFTNTILVTAEWDLSWDTPSDADTTEVIVVSDPNIPLCTNLISTPTTGVVPFTSTFACTWNNTSIFDIKVFDSLNAELYSSTTNTGSFNFTNTGTYNVSCFVENEITTTPVCINTITATNIEPTISIDKTDANPADSDGWTTDTQTILAGSWAIFSITVTNSGNEDLNTVVTTDILSPTCDRTDAQTQVLIQAIWNNDSVFNVWEIFTYNCTDPTVLVWYTNTVVTTAIWVTSTTAVTANDTSVIALPPVPSCDSLVVSQASGSAVYSSNFTCNATLATSQNIILTDPNGNIQSFPTQSGVFNIDTQWTYTAACFINGLTTTQPACIQNLSLSNGWGGWGGWWWGGWGWGWWAPDCLEAQFNTSSVSCTGSSRARFMKFTCSNWVVLTNSWNNNSFTLDDCNAGLTPYDPLNPTLPYDIFATTMNFSGAICSASRNGVSWFTRNNCQFSAIWWSWGPRCWDRAVQTYLWEECDGTIWCSSTCKLNINTLPSAGLLDIDVFNGTVVIWDQMDPYNIHSWLIPVLQNNGGINDDIVIDKFCAYKEPSNTSLTTSINPICTSIPGGILYPGQSVSLNGLTGNYFWNVSGIPAWNKIDDNDIIYTVQESDWNHELNAFFNKKLTVRVAKPTLTTTGWGTSFINNISQLSDITNIWNGISGIDSWKNKNFVWASIGELSSYTKWVTDTSQAESDASDLTESVIDNIDSISTSVFENYNGIDNVYIIDWPYVLNAITDGNTSKTYIIDWWDLIISDNIEYSWNIAFIVKWWNIVIRDHVTSIDGTYISISQWTRGGNIRGTNITTNVLQINGSIYWNMNNLLEKRTYIKNNSTWIIDVGTIVSFGSSVFRKPAPLTTKFIGEYIESKKVAQ